MLEYQSESTMPCHFHSQTAGFYRIFDFRRNTFDQAIRQSHMDMRIATNIRQPIGMCPKACEADYTTVINSIVERRNAWFMAFSAGGLKEQEVACKRAADEAPESHSE
jgi:hypothetical protein